MGRLEEIEERANRAIPGPWTNDCCKGLCPAGIWSKTADVPVVEVVRGEWGDKFPTIEVEGKGSVGLTGNEFMKFDAPVRAIEECIGYGTISDEMAKSNGDFIAHAREDIPWLIAEVKRLSAQGDANG